MTQVDFVFEPKIISWPRRFCWTRNPPGARAEKLSLTPGIAILDSVLERIPDNRGRFPAAQLLVSRPKNPRSQEMISAYYHVFLQYPTKESTLLSWEVVWVSLDALGLLGDSGRPSKSRIRKSVPDIADWNSGFGAGANPLCQGRISCCATACFASEKTFGARR